MHNSLTKPMPTTKSVFIEKITITKYNGTQNLLKLGQK